MFERTPLMTLQPTLFVFFFLTFSIVRAQEVNAPKFGDGILNLKGKDSTWSMKLGMQMQFQTIAEWKEENSNFSDPQVGFLIRRARLKFDGFVFSPKLSYEVAIGFANRDISEASEYTSNVPGNILDAVVKWDFYENFELWFGQTKLPGNRENLISSSKIQMVDRSLLNSSYSLERDLGFQLRHHFKLSEQFIIKEAFAISQGEGRNITSGNLGGFQYTSRLEVLPLGNFTEKGDYIGGDIYRETSPKLAFGMTYDFNNKAVRSHSNEGSFMLTDIGFFETNISTLFIDAMFKYQGFSLMAEYAERSAADPLAKNSDGSLTGDSVKTGNGLNLQAGYLFENNWEVSGRFTTIDFDKDISLDGAQNQYTLGVSKYIVDHQLKVQSDVSYLAIDHSNDQLMWRLQFSVSF